MASSGPSADEAGRFRADVEALAGSPPGRLGVAVSGGPDSVALLLLAAAAVPGAVEAATVDHRLRPESAGEAELVAGLCASLGVPHATLLPSAPIEGSLQAEARRARYALLEDWRRERGLALLVRGGHDRFAAPGGDQGRVPRLPALVRRRPRA